MSRAVLLNPGPVTLSERVRAALGRGDWCHREPEFAELTRAINQGLADVYPALSGRFEAVTLSGSGTAAVEGMLLGFAPRSGGTLVVSNGVYGERLTAMLEAQGKPCWSTEGSWLDPIDLGRVIALLDAHPEVSHVAAVHHETTTGRLNALDGLGRLCRERGLELLLDAVSSFGAEALDPDALGLAALASTANKCLHAAPGLSFVLARRELWREAPRSPGFYLDLHRYHAQQHTSGYSPFTLAVQTAFALREALVEHAEQGGASARRLRYLARAKRIAATLEAAGVTPLLAEPERSAVLWSWVLPARTSYAELHAALKARGIVIYAGQGSLSERIFRIAHMGELDAELDRVCGALAASLAAT